MITVKIDGMTCGHCVSAVRKAVLKLEPGAGVEIDLAFGMARVTGNTDGAEIVAAIMAEGYKAMITSEDRI